MTLRSMLKNKVDISLIQESKEKKYAHKNLSASFENVKLAQMAMKKLRVYEKTNNVHFDDIRSLLSEVIDDMKWLSDKKNNMVLWVDKKAKMVEGYVCKKFRLPKVMIRAHTSKKHLLVIGVFSEANIKEVETYVGGISGFKAVAYNEKSS